MKCEVAIIMGSKSDAKVMSEAAKILGEFNVKFETKVVSAHRTPEMMQTYAKEARARGIKVIIAGAGGAAHLPGMVASLTTLPVIGVPVSLKALNGLDSLLSIAQMPSGVPVATTAIDNAHNAGLLAVRILSLESNRLAKLLEQHQSRLKNKIFKSQAKVKNLMMNTSRLKLRKRS